MFRTFACLLASSLLLTGADKRSALDKPTLESYVRHLFVLNPQVKVEILDPQAADLPGFSKVAVRMSNGQATQDASFYVSKDGRKLMQANVWDIAENPFKAQLDK